MPDLAQRLDMDAVGELKNIMGDDFQTLIDTFNNDSQVRIEAIKAAVSSGDSEQIRRAAHSFKGSSGNMGALVLRDLCKQMEDCGHSGNVAGCEQLVKQIEAEYLSVQQALANL